MADNENPFLLYARGAGWGSRKRPIIVCESPSPPRRPPPPSTDAADGRRSVLRPVDQAAVRCVSEEDVLLGSQRNAVVDPDVRALGWDSAHARKKLPDVFARQFRGCLQRDEEMRRVLRPLVHRRAEGWDGDGKVGVELSFAIPTILPSDIIETHPHYPLREYQKEGAAFLLRRFFTGGGCILADDMGLGKTAQVSAMLQTLKRVYGIGGPHLVISPLSTTSSWKRELKAWAPDLSCTVVHGGTNRPRKCDVTLINPSAFLSQRRKLKAISWVTVIFDEAHMLKDPETNIGHHCFKLQSCFRIAVTGTPLLNSLDDLWGLVAVLFPTLFRRYLPQGTAQDAVAFTQKFMIRRTKATLSQGLPPKVEHEPMQLAPTPLQWALLTSIGRRYPLGGATAAQLRCHLLYMRFVCNHPLQLLMRGDGGDARERWDSANLPFNEACIIGLSPKLVECDKLIAEAFRQGRRVLIFSSFTTMLDILELYCQLRQYPFERLDGDTPRVERELAVQRFNHPHSKASIFLASTTAGGMGITLTGASVVVHYDNHFNPQMDRQAADRAHRLGQRRDVHVHSFVLLGTVEEPLRRASQHKAQLGDWVVDGVGDGDIIPKSEMISLMQIHKIDEEPVISDDCMPFYNSAVECIKKDRDVACKAATERAAPPNFTRRSVCFQCGEEGAEIFCAVCPKGFHRNCADPTGPLRTWRCPRHVCHECGKDQRREGTLFMCLACPKSRCFECLEANALHIDEAGNYSRLSTHYEGMEGEGVAVSRAVYYRVCPSCADAESGSSEEEESVLSLSDDES